MVPDAFGAFFAASAGVAGALIGLLFVAISVSPRLDDPAHRVEMDVRAGVAFSALSDTLVISLCALIPGVNLALPAIVVSVAAIGSCVGLSLLLMRGGPVAHRGRKLRLIAAAGRRVRAAAPRRAAAHVRRP